MREKINMYPTASVVTSDSLDVPAVTPFRTSEVRGELMLFGDIFSSLAFALTISATLSIRFSDFSEDKLVTAVKAFFKVILAKERADSVNGIIVESTGFVAEERSHDT